MKANERRTEIAKLMEVRRISTVVELAADLQVSERTIRRDILELSVDIPLETIQGNGGGVHIADWYHPHKNMLSQEQSFVLEQLMEYADDRQKEILRQMLAEFSSKAYRQKYEKEAYYGNTL